MKKILLCITTILLSSVVAINSLLLEEKNNINKVEKITSKTEQTLIPKNNDEVSNKETIEPKIKDDVSQNEVTKKVPENNVDKEKKISNSEINLDTQKEKPIASKPVEKINPWDTLGITEEQYYNKPMYSWERIDFTSMNECLTYGDNYQPYINGEVLYNCREVSSFSGNFLGVMFDTEKLN